MKDWFLGLSPRERVMVAGGSALVLALMTYTLLWEPLVQDLARVEQALAEQRDLKVWMQGAAEEVRRLRGRGAGGQADTRSLLAVVDNTARQARLSGAVKRIQPDGQARVRVTLEQASFDDLIQWLGTLEARKGVHVAELTVDRREQAGQVNARVTLRRSGG
ncbi:MAG TPA: type II secretion system protein M [Gammaproteobacteria bacterium]|nr:type II secretion system protein M [Gammaproteobacteria bacterium]